MVVDNKKALFDYEILESLEAGVALTGAETKSFYENRVTLQGSFARIIGGELYLVNAKFTLGTVPQGSQNRSRKLLIRKRELLNWEGRIKTSKLAIIPLSMYNKGRFIKLKLGLAKSRREFSKREKIRARDIEREAERDFRVKLN